MITLQQYSFREEIPERVYKQFYNLNFRDTGYMRKNLVKLKNKRCKKSKIFCYKLGDKIIGWGMCLPNTKCRDIYDVHLYVRSMFRGQNFGKNLLFEICEYLKSIDKLPGFFPYNEKTTIFFSKNNFHNGVIFD